MSIPGSRAGPCDEISCRYFEIKQLLLFKRFEFS
jgi:hypothetical protein